jgi:trehalose 6-phosphate phosphatase
MSMGQLFSDLGMRRLDHIVQPGMLCVFDFDGTLSPIVPQPDSACLPSEVRERLMALSLLAPLAILTGRSLQDIRPRLGFEPHYVVGNHGLEGVPGWEQRSADYADDCAAWRDALKRSLCDRQRFDPGIRIEDKRYSLSVHYRLAKNPKEAEQRLSALFATLSPPPRVVAGKFVYSLMPRHASNKGSAFEELMLQSGASSAIYVGDDVTDEDVFRLKRPDLLTVRIEPHPDSAADFYLPAMPDIVRLLDELVRRLARQAQDLSRKTTA